MSCFSQAVNDEAMPPLSAAARCEVFAEEMAILNPARPIRLIKILIIDHSSRGGLRRKGWPTAQNSLPKQNIDDRVRKAEVSDFA
jgi:hypothetical protein